MHLREPVLTTDSALEIIETPDGSATLQQTNSAIAFRSLKGAATESRHVFVEGSEIIHKPGAWRVLELGLGTGLNFMKTLEAFLNSPHADSLSYTAVERSPLDATTLQELGGLNDPTEGLATRIVLDAIHQNGTHRRVQIDSPKTIQFNLSVNALQDHQAPPLEVDAYYHDPFAPKDNPGCWTHECFRWAKSHLAPTGILVTYSASTAIRKSMATAGFFIAKRDGACGKREMTMAAMSPEWIKAGKLLPAHKQPPK